MAGVRREFQRRRDLVAEHVDRIEMVGEPDEVLVVGEVRRPSTLDLVVNRGRACDQPEHEVIAADVDPPFRVSRGQREGGRCGCQCGLDDVATDPDRVALDDGTGVSKVTSGLGAPEFDAEFFEHVQ